MKRAFAHIGFSIAVTLLVINLLPIRAIIPIMVGLAIIFAISLVLSKYRQALTVPLCVGSAIFACLVLITVYNSSTAPQLALDNSEADVAMYIVDLPSNNDEGRYVYTAKTQYINQSGAPQNIKLRITSDERIEAECYQVINANVRLSSLGDSAFNSYGYWSDGVFLTGKINSYDTTDEYVLSLNKYILGLRQYIIDTLSSNILGDEGALAIALITGDKSGLSYKTVNAFRYSGAAHLMAVSGFHLTVMAGMILAFTKRLHLSDRLQAVIVIFASLIYCGVAGFSKSIVRASIMLIAMMLGKLLSRRGDGLNSLGIAVAIICLNPFAVYDFGACLSVLSVLALLTLNPVLQRKSGIDFNKYKNSDFKKRLLMYVPLEFVKAVMLSLSVTVYTIPAMLLFFGYFSIVGMVSNIIITPIGSVTIVLSMLSCVVGSNHIVGDALFALSKWCNHIVLVLAERFASFRYSIIPYGNYFIIVIAGILVLFAFCFVSRNKSLFKTASLVGAMMFFTCFAFSAVKYNSSADLLICKDGAAVLRYKDNTIVYGVETKSDYYSVRQFLTANALDVEYLLVRRDNDYSQRLIESFDCDSVVVPYYDELILENENCKKYIMTSNLKIDGKDGFSFNFRADQSFSKLNISVNNECIAIDTYDSADIYFLGDVIYDCHGRINSSNGDVIYTINDKDDFTIRRLNKWEK